VTGLPLFSRSVVATAARPNNVLTDRAERRILISVGLQTYRTLKYLVSSFGLIASILLTEGSILVPSFGISE
jgi:hypothetical protein